MSIISLGKPDFCDLRCYPRSKDCTTSHRSHLQLRKIARFGVPGGTEPNTIDIEILPLAVSAGQGAGSGHHIACAVENRARQLEAREALMEPGYQVTPVIDRNDFWAIYFPTPNGVLFEIATNAPSFDVDEDTAHLGDSLTLPARHRHLREKFEHQLEPPED
jgi:glyoxalase family protein